MSHFHYDSIMTEFVLGELKGEELNKFHLHLDDCKECAASLASLKKIINIYETAPFDMPSDAYFASLVPQIREKLEDRDNVFSIFNISFSARWTGAIAAVFVVAISTLLLFNLQNTVYKEIAQIGDNYYSGALQTETISVAAISETFESEDWENLSGIIEEEMGEYSNLFNYDSEDHYPINLLSNEEWGEFYEKFNNQQIL